MYEKKIRTKNWSKRINDSILSMCFVDAYLLAQGCRGEPVNERDFITQLAEQLIDNKYLPRVLRPRRKRLTESKQLLCSPPTVNSTRQMTAPTPTKRRKRRDKNQRLQGKCMICKKLTTHVCQECQNKYVVGQLEYIKPEEFWICNKEGKRCMGRHIEQCHQAMIAEAEI